MIDESIMVAEAKLGNKWYGVFYRPAGKPVFAAERIQRTVAVFMSRPIVPSASVTSWKELSWTASGAEGTTMRVYARSATTESELENSQWTRPLLNASGEDISELTGRILQFRVVMVASYDPASGNASTPLCSSFSASCYIRSSDQTFYTKTLSLGFVPSHVLLTYNGTIPRDTLVEFSISTTDSINSKDFKIINPNTVESIEELARNPFLKVCISALGNTEIPFVIDEFAIAAGGESFTVISP